MPPVGESMYKTKHLFLLPIVKVNKDPVLVTTVLKLIPEKSNISKWLTMGTSVEEPPNSEAEDLLVVEKVES